MQEKRKEKKGKEKMGKIARLKISPRDPHHDAGSKSASSKRKNKLDSQVNALEQTAPHATLFCAVTRILRKLYAVRNNDDISPARS